MAKECSFNGCKAAVYSNRYCRFHQWAREDEKWLNARKAANVRRSISGFKRKLGSSEASKNPSQKRATPIAKHSQKRAEINRKEYEPEARAYRAEIGRCEVCIVIKAAGIDPGFKCCNEPQCIHHVKGKATISLLLDKRWWKVSCFLGNNWIEANSEKAEELQLKLPDYQSKLSNIKKT